MDVRYVNPILTATSEVFRTMLECEVTRGEIALRPTMGAAEHEISGMIGLSGGIAGTIVISLSRGVALEATAKMTFENHTEIDEDVVDAIAEMTNMIVGSAKRNMEDLDLTMGLPSVVVGKNHIISFDKGTKPIKITFDTEWGPFCIDVGFVGCPVAAS